MCSQDPTEAGARIKPLKVITKVRYRLKGPTLHVVVSSRARLPAAELISFGVLCGRDVGTRLHLLQRKSRECILSPVRLLLQDRLIPSGTLSNSNLNIEQTLSKHRANIEQTFPTLTCAQAGAAAITLGTANSLGPEGPVVELGGNVGVYLGRGLGFRQEELRGFLAAGTAAGLAAGFNAPIAAIFFALEVD
jgi:hypothetical protein